MRVLFAITLLILPITAEAQQGFLEPYHPNEYGPGLNSDATGRPFEWQTSPAYGPADPSSNVTPDAYGLGVGMDAYGRPVEPGCPPYDNGC
jgi:hypothetical protein